MMTEEYTEARRNMVEQQIAARGIKDLRVLDAMNCVPRHCFIPPDDLAWAYADGPLPIGYDQTISQPYIVALMTALLRVKPTDRVLEIGSGSGYQAAVLGELAAEVHTVELVPALAEFAKKNLSNLGYTHVKVHTGDGSFGWPAAAPYDGILVAAGAPQVPQNLLEQVVQGGRLVIPVGDRSVQRLEVWHRSGDNFDYEESVEVCFVPLRGKFGWKL